MEPNKTNKESRYSSFIFLEIRQEPLHLSVYRGPLYRNSMKLEIAYSVLNATCYFPRWSLRAPFIEATFQRTSLYFRERKALDEISVTRVITPRCFLFQNLRFTFRNHFPINNALFSRQNRRFGRNFSHATKPVLQKSISKSIGSFFRNSMKIVSLSVF